MATSFLGNRGEKQYTLGLGKLDPNKPLDRIANLEEKEELLFIKREKEREQEFAQVADRFSLPAHKKTTYTKPDRTGAIRELYKKAENYGRETNKGLR